MGLGRLCALSCQEVRLWLADLGVLVGSGIGDSQSTLGNQASGWGLVRRMGLQCVFRL